MPKEFGGTALTLQVRLASYTSLLPTEEHHEGPGLNMYFLIALMVVNQQGRPCPLRQAPHRRGRRG
jgi:hypothetical protein